MKGTGFPIRVLDMDSPFMFGLVREGTPEEREECKAHGRPEDLPVSLLGLDKEGCACVDGEEVAQRLADCWNACAGMEHPADEIARMRDGEKWLSGKLCEITAAAILGMGVQAAVVSDAPFGADYVLSVVKTVAGMANELREQRDALLEALKTVRPWMISAIEAGIEDLPGFDPATHAMVKLADAAIAKAEGRPQ